MLFTKLIHYIILALLFALSTAVGNLEDKTFLIMDYKERKFWPSPFLVHILTSPSPKRTHFDLPLQHVLVSPNYPVGSCGWEPTQMTMNVHSIMFLFAFCPSSTECNNNNEKKLANKMHKTYLVKPFQVSFISKKNIGFQTVLIIWVNTSTNITVCWWQMHISNMWLSILFKTFLAMFYMIYFTHCLKIKDGPEHSL